MPKPMDARGAEKDSRQVCATGLGLPLLGFAAAAHQLAGEAALARLKQLVETLIHRGEPDDAEPGDK